MFQQPMEKVVSICYLLCFSHVGHLVKVTFLWQFGVPNQGANGCQEKITSEAHFGGPGGDLVAPGSIFGSHLGSLLEPRPSKKGPWNVRLHSPSPRMALRSSQIGPSP